MHLKELFIQNVGPLSTVDVSLPYSNDGLPQPVVLVGSSGSGKSSLIAQIADAVWELHAAVFQDTAHYSGISRPYWIGLGGLHTRSGTDRSLTLTTFSDRAGKEVHTCAQSGTFDSETMESTLGGRFAPVVQWNETNPDKKVAPLDNEVLEDELRRSTLTVFPSWRYERPHWVTLSLTDMPPDLADNTRVKGQLGRELVVCESSMANEAWILDLIRDARLEVDPVLQPVQGGQMSVQWRGTASHRLQVSYAGLQNINTILRDILDDREAKIIADHRGSVHRLAIRLGRSTSPVVLSQLSAGQAVLFNMFSTIIRYADNVDANMAANLQDIRGIALIDEIDAHLDAKLQREVLPSLIARLPNVQFIVTSHAPLFLLGMENRFGSEGFECREMPSGQVISAERFSEFDRSYGYYTATKHHEEQLRLRLANDIRPLVLTEGTTDARHLQRALEILGHSDLLSKITIEQVGTETESGTRDGGKSGLNRAWGHFRRWHAEGARIIVLLYDQDANKEDEQSGNIYIRSLPKNPANQCVQKGIESLYPEGLFVEKFYVDREPDGYGARRQEFDKTHFCDWVCNELTDPESFAAFDAVAEMLWTILGGPVQEDVADE